MRYGMTNEALTQINRRHDPAPEDALRHPQLYHSVAHRLYIYTHLRNLKQQQEVITVCVINKETHCERSTIQ